MHRHISLTGFTLIELLVVIAVIGVLAGAVVAIINPAAMLDRARIAKGKSFQGQLTKGPLGFDNVGAWNFNEASNPGADTSGNNATGTLIGGTSHVSNCDLGFTGCMSFDGVDDTIVLGNLPKLNVANKTVAFWAKPTIPITSLQVIFGNGGGNYYIAFHSGNILYTSHRTSLEAQQTTASSSNTVDIGRWSHYAFVFSVSDPNVTINMYKNGERVKSTTYASGYGTAYGTTFRISGFDAATYFYNGSLDEVYIFAQALSQTMIHQLYAQGRTLHLAAR